ncbi:MAG: hypothetical protein KJ069_24280 [Anaerolineae bacterium]|nr:hypothetical protein [Anaerolineae bacterium]
MRAKRRGTGGYLYLLKHNAAAFSWGTVHIASFYFTEQPTISVTGVEE